MTTYWDELLLDIDHKRQIQEQMEESNGKNDSFSQEDWDRGVQEGRIELPDQVIEFDEHLLLGERVSFRLPRLLMPVPRGLAATEYGMSGNDQHLFRDKGRQVLFGLKWTTQALAMEQVETYQDALLRQLQSLKSDMQIMETIMLEADGLQVGCCESLFQLPTGYGYQVLFMTSLEERLLLGSFQFPLEEAELWQPLSAAMIRALRRK
ncbi:hypothetical protein [Paenibacillus elgii]|uniref:hypothetical protein n=1 Tax=Paenibacillus elgii TaxID=189691 RepID=UPI0013D2691A|nr:hypothetical protein [Paenibacillus elgii]